MYDNEIKNNDNHDNGRIHPPVAPFTNIDLLQSQYG